MYIMQIMQIMQIMYIMQIITLDKCITANLHNSVESKIAADSSKLACGSEQHELVCSLSEGCSKLLCARAI